MMETELNKVNPLDENEKKTPESLPSLASIFKPEEFFEIDPVEETALSRICCIIE